MGINSAAGDGGSYNGRPYYQSFANLSLNHQQSTMEKRYIVGALNR
jgi:hypothetical protein